MLPQTAGSDLRDEILRARKVTDSLFERVLPEAMYERPIPERHRLLFYLGHLESFDLSQIGRHAGATVSTELDCLFARGIDPGQETLPQDDPRDWPTLAQTRQYVKEVRQELDGLQEQADADALNMAIEHRLMHAETITYLLHNLPYSMRLTRRAMVQPCGEPPPMRMITIPEGPATLGRTLAQGFGWDNEFIQHKKDVPAFRISRYKITNGQYLQFVREGGPVPHYWKKHGEHWFYRGFDFEMPLPRDWPVHISYLQAEAWARWARKALPTEAQYHRAAFAAPRSQERSFPWGEAVPRKNFGHFDSYCADPVPVTATPTGNSAFGVSQLMGNGWEWTRTVFQPFPGFQPHPQYPGYSADFFDGQHYVLKGASGVTDLRLLRPSFRNWFRQEYPYAYTTFRVVEE